jgi:hypothetical protein
LGSDAELTEIEHLIDIEHDHETVIEPVHAGANLRPALIEIDWIGLIA